MKNIELQKKLHRNQSGVNKEKLEQDKHETLAPAEKNDVR